MAGPRRSSEGAIGARPQLLACLQPSWTLELPAAGGRRSGLSGGQENSDQSIRDRSLQRRLSIRTSAAGTRPGGPFRVCMSGIQHMAGQWHVLLATGIFALAARGRNRFEPVLPATRKSTHSLPAGGCSCLCHCNHRRNQRMGYGPIKNYKGILV